MNKKSVFYILTTVCVLFLQLSCESTKIAQTKRSISIPDGIYAYDMVRVMDLYNENKELAETGYNAHIEYVSYGCGVLVKDDSFIEPYTNLELQVHSDGSVTCASNPKLTGKYTMADEKLTLSGIYTENGMPYVTQISASFIPTPTYSRAPDAYNGIYTLNDSKDTILVENGIYKFKAFEEDAPVNTRFGIVQTDGTFRNYMTMITTMEMGSKENGTYTSSSFSNLYEEKGKLNKDGTVELSIAKNDTGGVGNTWGTPVAYSGIKASQTKVAITQDGKTTTSSETNFLYDSTKINYSNAPKWYSDSFVTSEGFIYICGCKSGIILGKNAALSFAEIEAATALSRYVNTDVNTKTETKETFTENNDSLVNTKEIKTTFESLSVNQIPYSVEKEFYDSKNDVAYVLIKTSANVK